VHTVRCTSGNDHDITQAHRLLHGHEKNVWADAGCQGVEKRPGAVSPRSPPPLRARVEFATLDVFNDKESDMKESHRLRIERHVEEFAAWRASGLTLQTFVQQRGEELTVWRARLTWERRWQQMLEGTYQKPAAQKRTTAFVKAIAQQGHRSSSTA